MKNRKYGFTLAEVLITLVIIGVVAAMSAPALIQHASAAKTGPAMSRAISALSNGMQAFLFANDANKINQSSPVAKKSNELFAHLGTYNVKMSASLVGGIPIVADGTKDAEEIVSPENVQVFQFGDRSAVYVPLKECNPGDGSSTVGGGTNDKNGCPFYFAPIGWASKDRLVIGDDAFELAYDNEGNILIYGLEYGKLWSDGCSEPKEMSASSDKKSCGGRIAAMNYKKDY